MDIIYKLTNTNKSEGVRFYIGSKQECKVVELNGINVMISVNSGKRYIGSSTNFEFKSDLQNGHVFDTEILEIVPAKLRKNLNDIENKWIKKYNAVESKDFYNLSYAIKGGRCNENIVNIYGQTMKELAKDNSTCSNRDSTARELGFSNFGELCFKIHEDYKILKSWKEVSDTFSKHRHFAISVTKGMDMDKSVKDLEKVELIPEIRKLVGFENCSLKKACNMLNIEISAGRIMLGDYVYDKKYGVAFSLGYTENELEVTVTKLILEGKGFQEVSRELGIVLESVKRLFFRKIRNILKPEDVK